MTHQPSGAKRLRRDLGICEIVQMLISSLHPHWCVPVNEKVPFTLACIAVLAFACGPRPRGEAVTDRTPTQRSVAADPNTPLTPTLEVDVAENVRFTFHVTNDGAKKLELLFSDGRTHDVAVLDASGREVWRWSEGRLFTQNVQSKVLRAKDQMVFEEAWENAAPGNYTAVVTLGSRNFPVEHRADFTVTRALVADR